MGPGEERRVPGRGSKERISNKENVKRGKVEFYMAVHTMRVNTKVKSYVLWLCIPRLGAQHTYTPYPNTCNMHAYLFITK